nr:DNA topoisomerase VI subunit B [Methanomethylovorans sp.]
PFKIRETTPEPKVISMGNDFDYVWKISVSTGSSKAISYLVDTLSDAEAAKFPELIVEGLDEELVTGAKAIMGLV